MGSVTHSHIEIVMELFLLLVLVALVMFLLGRIRIPRMSRDEYRQYLAARRVMRHARWRRW